MGLNPNATYATTVQVGSKTFNVDCESFERTITNKPIVINKPMTNQNGTNEPETLYKDLKNINNSITVVARVYSDGTNSPLYVAEDLIDKLHKEAPPVILTYRGTAMNCVFATMNYKDISTTSQKWKSTINTYGGNSSPEYIRIVLTLIKGTKRI